VHVSQEYCATLYPRRHGWHASTQACRGLACHHCAYPTSQSPGASYHKPTTPAVLARLVGPLDLPPRGQQQGGGAGAAEREHRPGARPAGAGAPAEARVEAEEREVGACCLRTLCRAPHTAHPPLLRSLPHTRRRAAIDRQIDIERKKRQHIDRRKGEELDAERGGLAHWQQQLQQQQQLLQEGDESDYEEEQAEHQAGHGQQQQQQQQGGGRCRTTNTTTARGGGQAAGEHGWRAGVSARAQGVHTPGVSAQAKAYWCRCLLLSPLCTPILLPEGSTAGPRHCPPLLVAGAARMMMKPMTTRRMHKSGGRRRLAPASRRVWAQRMTLRLCPHTQSYRWAAGGRAMMSYPAPGSKPDLEAACSHACVASLSCMCCASAQEQAGCVHQSSVFDLRPRTYQ